jgi:putative toxin-antitoxin system antitoxin component (TIGR02293 family)
MDPQIVEAAKTAPSPKTRRSRAAPRAGVPHRTARQGAEGSAWLALREAIVRESPAERIQRIRAGLSADLLVKAAERFGMPREVLFRLVGLPFSTANRKIARGETLDPAVTERLVRLALVDSQAEKVFADPALASRWLASDNLALGGAAPLALLDTEIGAREVAKVLAAIAWGGVA